MNELIDLLQWPAMLVTVLATWLVGSRDRRRRKVGFRVFLASNALWIAWGCRPRRTRWWRCSCAWRR